MGRAAYGTLLRAGDGAATEVYTTISEIRDIAGGLESLDTEDMTHQQSTAEEVVGTVLRTNEITFQINHDPRNATHVAIRTDMQNRTLRSLKIARPAATSSAVWDICSFSGYYTNISPSYAVTGGLVADVTIKQSGIASYTTATSATG
jgi:hypothetical protein